ncbi:DNA repair protein [Salmonella enterica subsp. enterica serovar Berta]|nr:DNA repair protein [Salmonella enterica subsp. enterica serovar Berta]
MVKILNTTGINYYLEQIISSAQDRLIIISPYLKLSDRIKELIEDKNRLKVDIRIVYGKSELNPEQHNWLLNLPYVRLSFCQNLHAKFYANESDALICSLNLYDFSQINNHEIGVLINKNNDLEPYSDAMNESQKIIRISTENLAHNDINLISIEKNNDSDNDGDFITSSSLSKKHNISLSDCYKKLLELGYLSNESGFYTLTDKGKDIGASFHPNKYKKGAYYFLWPKTLELI